MKDLVYAPRSSTTAVDLYVRYSIVLVVYKAVATFQQHPRDRRPLCRASINLRAFSRSSSRTQLEAGVQCFTAQREGWAAEQRATPRCHALGQQGWGRLSADTDMNARTVVGLGNNAAADKPVGLRHNEEMFVSVRMC